MTSQAEAYPEDLFADLLEVRTADHGVISRRIVEPRCLVVLIHHMDADLST